MLTRAKRMISSPAEKVEATVERETAESPDLSKAAAILAELRPEVAELRLRAERLRQRYG
jgi:hypothetical protein